MGFFSKLFKGPEIDMEKSDANAKKMRALFHQAVGGGEDYRLIFGYTMGSSTGVKQRLGICWSVGMRRVRQL